MKDLNHIPDSLLQALSDSLKASFNQDTLFVVVESGNSEADLVQIISLIIALLAVVIGPFIQMRINKKQIETQLKTHKEQVDLQTEILNKTLTAQVKSTNRQNWIDDLRNSISEFVSIALSFKIQVVKDKNHPDLIDSFTKLISLQSKIQMMLNPEKELQNEIIGYTHLILNLAQLDEDEKNLDFNKIGETVALLRSSSQKLFRLHWQKVKNLE